MPVQTTNTSYVYFPDGCKVEYSTDGLSFTDLGAINSAATATLEYDINEVLTANAGTLRRQIRNMRMTGGFTLINLDPAGIAGLSGGMLTVATVSATAAVTTMPDQIIPSGWTDKKVIALTPVKSPADSTPLKCSAAPTLTSVTGSVDGALAENDDYEIVVDPNAYSGYGIVLNVVGGGALTTTAQTITVNYASITPVATTTVKGGTSTYEMTARVLRFTHTNSSGKTRTLTLFAVDVDSGGFVFSYKGANEDGTEEMPIAFVAKLDTSKTDGEQLFTWAIDAGY